MTLTAWSPVTSRAMGAVLGLVANARRGGDSGAAGVAAGLRGVSERAAGGRRGVARDRGRDRVRDDGVLCVAVVPGGQRARDTAAAAGRGRGLLPVAVPQLGAARRGAG